MKKLTVLLIFTILNHYAYGYKFDIRDASTGKTFTKSDGVTITTTASIVEIWNWDGNGRHITYPDVINCDSRIDPYEGKDIEISVPFCSGWNISKADHFHDKYVFVISKSGYESATIIKVDDPMDLYDGGPDEIYVQLIPQKQNLNIDGNLNVNQKVTNTESLGVLSTLEIANKLGVDESVIIKLIQSQKLKGKKIGDKYFVRTTDFNTYMKQ